MSLWEYKIITSGKGGFASPALLEKFLNDLGRDEWEIVQFHAQPDNFLVFTGLARRSTQRDWTLADAAAAAAKAEAEKLRAEFEAKFKAATSGASQGTAEEAATFLEEKLAPEDGFRKPIDVSHDADADAEAEEEKEEDDDWDKLTAAEEDELPTFFDAIKPHMRRNQRGPGMSVGVDYLAKKWDQSEEDLKGALVECGFTLPADEDAKPEYLEFEGDLYWINVNRRGELWINTKEKPRPLFRSVKAQKVAVEEEQKPDAGDRKHENRHNRENQHKQAPQEQPRQEPAELVQGGEPIAAPEVPQTEAAPAQLPSGPALLEKIRPMMRRNRRGPGGSGSVSFLSRALKCRDADLIAAFKELGLVIPTSPNEKPANVEIGNGIWWVNTDSRGNVWINGRDKKAGEIVGGPESSEAQQDATSAGDEQLAGNGEPSAPEAATASGESLPAVVPAEAVPASAGPEGVPAPELVPAAAAGSSAQPTNAATNETLAGIRPLLKETRTGALAGRIERIAEAAGKSVEDMIAQLTAAGLVVPEKPREKPVFAEHAGEIFWFNRNAKGELWLNAKQSKFTDRKSGSEGEGTDAGAEGESDKKAPRRPRGRRKSD